MRRAARGACGFMAAAGAALLALGLRGAPSPPPIAAPSPGAASAVPALAAKTVPRIVPVRVIIPAIGVDAAVVPEGVTASGSLQVPPLSARNTAGWWDGGPAPGQDGAAVIVGHVDSAQAGPLVFWRLRELRPGDIAETEPGGLRFEVTRVTEVAKDAFPTSQVYGPAKGPELRLITCGGAFDPATGSYLDNVIAYAVEVKA